jgi:hypothetical protein
MKTLQIKLLSFKELSDDAKKRVLKDKAEDVYSDRDNFTLGECMDSLKAIVSACDLRLSDWNIGPHNRNNFAKVECDDEGNRALARFLRVLLAHGYKRPKKFADMVFPGHCGFTGVCFDEDIAETVWKSLIGGETLGKAFDCAADEIASICEKDLEYRASEAGILECLDEDEEAYEEDGSRF